MTDWTELGRKFDEIMTRMTWDEHSDLHGAEFYGEAMRRLHERTREFVTLTEHYHVLDMNRKVDRANGEAAQEQLKREREKYARNMADSRHVLANAIRRGVNERSVPSRLRREGVLLAADWLDPPAVTNDQAA